MRVGRAGRCVIERYCKDKIFTALSRRLTFNSRYPVKAEACSSELPELSTDGVCGRGTLLTDVSALQVVASSAGPQIS